MEFSVIDLARLVEARNAVVSEDSAIECETKIRRDLGDAGPILDTRAKVDYRRRLGELREELAVAERLNDIGNVQRVREELELVTDELTAAIGRHGRDRKAVSHIERARSMVSKRIRFSMRQIQKVNAGLGEHLSQSIRTGYYCAYLPKNPVNWNL